MLRSWTSPAILILAAALPAQWPTISPPSPPPGIPTSPPPVSHPALAAQPLIQPEPSREDQTQPPPPPATAPADECKDPVARAEVEAARAALEFRARAVKGKELRTAIDRVLKGLDWHEDFDRAAALARATNKPLLWVQMLGDVDGFT